MTDDGFQSLADASYAKVFYHCLKLVGNEHDAADIVQNTFLKAFLGHGRVLKRESLEAWLFVICNNEIKQFYRAAKKTPCTEKTAAPGERGAGSGHEALYRAIDRLPEAQRQAVLLKYFAGYTMAELALALSVRAVTVKSRLYEARQALKRALAADAALPTFTNSQKERRHYLMSILNLCAVGAKTIPWRSITTRLTASIFRKFGFR